jgi:hypothetical protein
MIAQVKKGDRLVAYAAERPKSRVFIEVTRVARDGAWADIRCYTWAVMWTKRQPLPLDFVVPRDWGMADMEEQEADHIAWLKEEGILK